MGVSLINYIQKRLNSLLFRILCIAYAIVIISISINQFPLWVYYVTIAMYFISYIILNKYSKCRLLVDFIFTLVILWNKDINISYCYLFTLLPIINSINYSGKNKSFMTLYIGVCLCIVILEKNINIFNFIAPLFLFFIDLYTWQKRKTNDVLYELSEHVDSYFTQSEVIQKPHQIYKNIIKEINIFLKGDYVDSIYSYILKDDNILWLINSSEFIWERTLVLSSDDIDSLKQTKSLYRIHDNKMYYYYLIKIDTMDYIFVSSMHKSIPIYYQLIGIDCIFIAVFSKIAKLLNSEYRVFEYKNKTFEEMREKLAYVNAATKIMHYMRNKLTPLTNIVEYYSSTEELSENIKDKMEARIKKEVKQSSRDLQEIIETADYMLEKSNNPLSALEIKDISIKKIFVILSEIDERLLSGIVLVNKEIMDLKDNLVVRTSLTETKILFTDWINNMRKYKKDKCRIEFTVDKEYARIDFYNDYSISQKECDTLIKDINNNQKDAVLQRKTHGIYQIKSIVQNLDIAIKANREVEIDKDTGEQNHYIHLSINYKLYNKNEDSSN